MGIVRTMQEALAKQMRKYTMAGGTFAVAMGIGFFMQQGDAAASLRATSTATVTYPSLQRAQISTAVVPTDVFDQAEYEKTQGDSGPVLSAVAVAPSVGLDKTLTEDSIPDVIRVAAPATAEAPAADNIFGAKLEAPAPIADPCDIAFDAKPDAAAMVQMALTAPCHTDAVVTIHHAGMMFTLKTDDTGAVDFLAPALAEDATYLASFEDGASASAQAEVTSLAFFDRVVVQWSGDSGLELHAREYGASYGDTGHVWAAAAREVGSAARGQGGFLVTLGDASVAEPRLAQVYTFPTGMVSRAGDVALTVEAEITASNCARRVEAQTLQLRPEQAVTIRDLNVDMPDCSVQGDFLVMSQLVQDLTIAAN